MIITRARYSMRLDSLKAKGGFTLVELLVVIVVLAILAAIVLPKFAGSSLRSKESVLRANLKMLGEAAQRFHTDTSMTPITIDALYGDTAPATAYDSEFNEQTLDASAWHGPYCSRPADPFNGRDDDYWVTHIYQIGDSPETCCRISYSSSTKGTNGIEYCLW